MRKSVVVPIFLQLCLIGGCRFAKLADNLDLVTGIWVKLLGKLEFLKQYLI